MKKTDIVTIIFVATVGVLVAYFVASNLTFLKLPKTGVEVQTITKMTQDIEQPDTTIFNSDAINPTVETVVGTTPST